MVILLGYGEYLNVVAFVVSKIAYTLLTVIGNVTFCTLAVVVPCWITKPLANLTYPFNAIFADTIPPLFAAPTNAFTNAVVAILVELSLEAGVVTFGVPVKVGFASGALALNSLLVAYVLTMLLPFLS